MSAIYNFLASPVFVFGVIIRLLVLYYFEPVVALEWYDPFVVTSVQAQSLNPWSTWLETGGSIDAFPYGYAMWGTLVLGVLFTSPFGLPSIVGYKLILLIVDIVQVLSLLFLFPKRSKLIANIYWLSPICLLVTYVLGYNDVIPAAFLMLSCLAFRSSNHILIGGFLLAMAVSAKFSMVFALPIFIIYLFRGEFPLMQRMQFFWGLTLGGLLLIFPQLVNSSASTMLFQSARIEDISQLILPVSVDLYLYLIPFIYSIAVYVIWNIKYFNFEMFISILGSVFMVLSILNPMAPGWILWAMPFLAGFQAIGGKKTTICTIIFSLIFCVKILFSYRTGSPFDLETFSYTLDQKFSEFLNVQYALDTALVSTGVILVAQMWAVSVRGNNFFRLTKKPVVIGIAGDSGSGKDTLSDALVDVFGLNNVATLSGDDYHLWERQRPLWSVMTHLNPVANNLQKFSSDIMALSAGESVLVRHYDHATGQFVLPARVKGRKFVIGSGLHALYQPSVCEIYDLTIFLDIDENLRRLFKLRRDTKERGHTVERVLQALEKREPDAEKFIRPQKHTADLILRVKPISPINPGADDNFEVPRLKLEIETRQNFNELFLYRVLVGFCGADVDIRVSEGNSRTKMTVNSEISDDSLRMANKHINPIVCEFLGEGTKWHSGIIGLMQLIVLSHVNQILKKRLLK